MIPFRRSVCHTTFLIRSLIVTAAVLIISATTSLAGSYLVTPGSAGNLIHLELIKPATEAKTFSVQLREAPDWCEVESIIILNDRVPEIRLEFNITPSVLPGSTSDLLFDIEALDRAGAPVYQTMRTLTLTVAASAPAFQRDYVIEECCIDLADGADPTPVIPTSHILFGNSPNPFHSTTQIRFGLAAEESVDLRICDITGRLVRQIKTRRLPAGYHQITWSGKDSQGQEISPGIYFYELATSDWVYSQKMLIVK